MGHQIIETDQQRVAGKAGQGGIGAVAQAGGGQRQDLPHALPGGLHPFQEGAGGGSHIADAVPARQRGRVQEKAADALNIHGWAGPSCQGAGKMSQAAMG